MGGCGFLANHYPFILVTIVLPLVPLAYIVLGHLYSVLRSRRLYYRGGRLTTYSILLIPIIIMLGSAFFKAAYDYTYITMVVGGSGPNSGAIPIYWQSIATNQDYRRLENIAYCLAPYYSLAGLTLGLVPGVILLRRATEAWTIHVIPAIMGSIMFAELEAAPIKEMYFALGFLKEHNLPLGTKPFQLIAWPIWEKHLILGFIAGLLLSLTTYVLARSHASNYYRLEAI